MLSYPNVLLVLLALLPICLVVLPVMLAAGSGLFRLVNWLLIQVPARLSRRIEAPQPVAVPRELRQHARLHVSGTSVNVTDGCIFCTALVENISGLGICMKRLPKTLYQQADRLTVFINDGNGRQVLHVQPRWHRDGITGKTVGAQILNPPAEWETYLGNVHQLRPVPVTVRS